VNETTVEPPGASGGATAPSEPPRRGTSAVTGGRIRTVVVVAAALVGMGAVVAVGMFAVNSVAGGSPQRAATDATELAASQVEATSAVATPTVVAAPSLAATTTSAAPKATAAAASASPSAEPKSTRGGSTRSPTAAAGTSSAHPRATNPTAAAATRTTSSIGVIRNLGNGLCVDLSGRGSVAENVLVQQHACNVGSADNQMYQSISADGGSTFLLRNIRSGWCLDVNGSDSVAPNIVVNTHTCLFGDQDNQMFRKEPHGSGFYLVNVKSGLCLGVSYADGKQDAYQQPLILATCGDSGGRDVWSFG